MDSVNLRIKSPSAEYADINLSVSVHETVLDIKNRIEAEYASSPAPDHQKLVYSGKLLQNTMVLKDFLRFEDDCSVYTVHLVCSLLSSKPEPSDVNTSTSSDGLRNRHDPVFNNLMNQQQADVPDLTTTAAAVGGDSGDLEAIRDMLTNLIQGNLASGNVSAEEMMALGQVQAQYAALYSQHLQQQPVVEQTVTQFAAQQLQQQQPPQQPAPDAVAAAGDEEDQGNNDLLEYAYSVIRVLILLCVMYVHSSFFRLLFVAGGMLLAYLFQGRNRREINNNNNQNNNEPVNENLVGHEDVADVQEAVASDEETVAEEPKPNVLVVAFTFVTSLITSILPEQNQVI